VEEAEVASVLTLARSLGIKVLDTASLYGTSEAVLGHCGVSDFRVVTKTPRFAKDVIEAKDADALVAAFETSLDRLKIPRTFALLAHHAPDLLTRGGENLISALRELRRDRRVERIGVSIYRGSEIDALLERYDDIDLIQVPLNVIDRRLIYGGQIRRMAERGIDIHVRSAFLQGLLLAPTRELPPGLVGLRPILEGWNRLVIENQVSHAQGALGFLRTVPEISAVIVGVTSRDELAEIATAFETAPKFHANEIICNNPDLLDPSRWSAS
jgi:aryl-alcohol dehydrogenase-like predicted oxidoreductase